MKRTALDLRLHRTPPEKCLPADMLMPSQGGGGEHGGGVGEPGLLLWTSWTGSCVGRGLSETVGLELQDEGGSAMYARKRNSPPGPVFLHAGGNMA